MVASKSKKSRPRVMKFRQSLFWDVDPKTIDPKKHARYIIERILDFGNDKEVRWMWRYYPKDMLKNTLDTSRVIHKKSKSFWSLLFK